MRIDRRLLAAALIALVAAGVGGLLLAGAGGDASRRHGTVSGVPLDEVHPSGVAAGARRPGVVVAHGFAGSARLMAQFGDSLSARGYVVVLLDFSGHGANRHPLPDAGASTADSTAALQRDLDIAVAHLRALPDVDPSRIALVGHSMGASAVTRYAVAHPEITATVAISLPGSSVVLPDRPARLLLLVGAFEFPGFRAEASRAIALGGQNRSMVIVPRVEHISILYAQRTHRETAAWLDDSFGGPPADRAMPSPVRRVAGAAALLSGLLVGLFPIAWLLFGGTRHRLPGLALPHLVRTVVVAAVATAGAALIAPWLPTRYLPLAVGSYVVGFTATAGAAILAYLQWRKTTPKPLRAHSELRLRGGLQDQRLRQEQRLLQDQRLRQEQRLLQEQRLRQEQRLLRPSRRRQALAAPILVGYAAVTIAVPVHLGLTHAIPVGARWWLLALVWVGFAVLAFAGERLAGGNPLGVLAVSAIAVAALTAAAIAGLTSGFVLLVVPLLAVLLVWQAVWSAVLHGFAAPSWLIALVGSLIVAWPIATTLPVTG